MKRILITRPRLQADAFAQELQAAGFEPIFFPVIEIRPMEDMGQLDRALKGLQKYHWVIFTSVNAVDVVFDRIPAGLLTAGTALPRVAAIGPKTAEALAKRGITPAFVPDEYVAEAILPGLGDLCEKWVFLPRAEIARKVLPEAIAAAGGFAHEVAVYKTLPAMPDPAGLAALRAGVDFITLTSPSTVQNFCSIMRSEGLDPHNLLGSPVFACIGPITEAAAREEGLENLVIANEYTSHGLVELISNLSKGQ
jgi:uroporphyrinogen III methyltransferase/synthase